LRLRARIVAVAAILENPEGLALSLLCLLPDKDGLLAGREAAAKVPDPCGHDLARRIVYAGVDTRIGNTMRRRRHQSCQSAEKRFHCHHAPCRGQS
jgi:hypothetical protein